MSEHATRSMEPIDWSTINAIYSDSADSLLRIRTIGDEGVHDPFVSCWHSDPVSYTLAGTFSYKHKLTRTRPHVRYVHRCARIGRHRYRSNTEDSEAARTHVPLAPRRLLHVMSPYEIFADFAPSTLRASGGHSRNPDITLTDESRTNDNANNLVNLILWIFWDGAFFSLLASFYTYFFFIYLYILDSIVRDFTFIVVHAKIYSNLFFLGQE